MFRKTVYLFLVIGTLIGLSGQTASAHVLFIDKKTNIAAVFHSNPEDNPIAGQTAELYFDIQDKNSEVRIPYTGYDLLITSEDGEATIVPIRASGSTVIAKHTFPSQGLYRLSLKSKPNFDQFQKVSIDGSLRVNRGIGVAAVSTNHDWATIGLIASATAVILLTVLFVNNRRTILDKSRF